MAQKSLFAQWPAAGSVRGFGRATVSLGLIFVAMSVAVDIFIASWTYQLTAHSIIDIQSAAAGSDIQLLQQQIATTTVWNNGMLALGFALILVGIFAVLMRHLHIALRHEK
jgi:hypothetical protein